MKTYDIEIRNYGICYVYHKERKCFTGHIDYIGKNPNRKRQGNSFMLYTNGDIAYDFPYDVPKYVNDKLQWLVKA